MSFVSNGLSWLQSQLAASAGEAITYVAETNTIEIPNAVFGKSEYESDDGTGLKIRSIVTDWLISPDQLTVDDEPLEPKPGHLIQQIVGSVTRTFEVQTLGDEGCWRWSGPSLDRLRIHVREIPS
jgi:hypothetical protein